MNVSVTEFEHAGWQKAAASYAATFAAATCPYVDALLDSVGIQPGMRLLDLACGTGAAAAEANRRGSQVVGADFSRDMLHEARKACPAVLFQEADAHQLPFAASSFDAAVSNFGVHHFERPEVAIAEVWRILRPGGIFAFTVWAKPNPAWQIIFDALGRADGRVDVGLPAANGNMDTIGAVQVLAARGGFRRSKVQAQVLERRWLVPRGSDLLCAFCSGTVRMSALLRAQPESVLQGMRRDIAAQLEGLGGGDGPLEVPTRAWLVRSEKVAGADDSKPADDLGP